MTGLEESAPAVLAAEAAEAVEELPETEEHALNMDAETARAMQILTALRDFFNISKPLSILFAAS